MSDLRLWSAKTVAEAAGLNLGTFNMYLHRGQFPGPVVGRGIARWFTLEEATIIIGVGDLMRLGVPVNPARDIVTAALAGRQHLAEWAMADGERLKEEAARRLGVIP